MDLQKLFRAYFIVTVLVLGTLIYSGFLTQTFFNKQKDFSSIVTRGEDRVTIKQACENLHRPYIVQFFPILLAATLLLILIGIAFTIFVSQQHPTRTLQRSVIIGATLVTLIIYLGVQLWEPDYLFTMCRLV